MARIAKDAICESFSLREGKFTFYENLNNPEAFNKEIVDCDIEIAVDTVLMEAARRMDDWEAIRNSLPSENDIYRIFTTDEHALF